MLLITVIGLKDGRFARDFCLADTLVLLDQHGSVVLHMPSPMRSAPAAGASVLLGIFQHQRVERVIVGAIGDALLAALQQVSIEVFKAPRSFSLRGQQVCDLTGCIRLEPVAPLTRVLEEGLL